MAPGRAPRSASAIILLDVFARLADVQIRLHRSVWTKPSNQWILRLAARQIVRQNDSEAIDRNFAERGFQFNTRGAAASAGPGFRSLRQMAIFRAFGFCKCADALRLDRDFTLRLFAQGREPSPPARARGRCSASRKVTFSFGLGLPGALGNVAMIFIRSRQENMAEATFEKPIKGTAGNER